MRVRVAHGCVALLLLHAGTAVACSISPLPETREARVAYFIATPLDEAVDVRTPSWCEGCAPTVRGQLARVGKVGGIEAAAVRSAARAAGQRIVLVPWDTKPDCRPEVWQKAVPYWQSSVPGFFTAQLRDRAQWVDGQPTFDVGVAYLEPYPYGELLQSSGGERLGGFELTVDQYFSLFDALPGAAEYKRDPRAAARGVAAWQAKHPDWAVKPPAPAILAQFRAAGVAAAPRRTDTPQPIDTPTPGPGPLPPEKLRRE